MKRTLVFCIGLAALSLAPSVAMADDGPTEDARARGKQLFDAALADVKREDYKAACPKFRASYDVDPKASTLLNLGTCYARNGQTASAWGAFSSAVVAAKKAGKEDWAAQADEQVKALEPRLVRLTVEVPHDARVEGLVVTRDASTLSESEYGLAMAVDPGEHTIKAAAHGYVAWQTKVTVAEGTQLKPVGIPKLVEEPKAVVNFPRDSHGPGAGPPVYWTTTRVAGASAAGIGVVALGVGSVLGILAKSKYDDSRAACPTPTCGDPTAVESNSSAFGMATGSTVLFVAGGVLAAGGIGLFLWAPDAKKKTAGHAQLFPSASRTSATLELGGTF